MVSLYGLQAFIAFASYVSVAVICFLPNGHREIAGGYALVVSICLCTICRSAWHCCSRSDACVEHLPQIQKLFHPAPGPDLLEGLFTLAVLLLSFPLSASRIVSIANNDEVPDSAFPVWYLLGTLPNGFKLVQTVVCYYVARPPIPFTKRCMDIVSVIAIQEGLLYVVLVFKSFNMFMLATRLVNKTVVLPQPNMLISSAGSYFGAVAVASLLGALFLFRIFWMLRGICALISLASAPKGTSARRFRQFVHRHEKAEANKEEEEEEEEELNVEYFRRASASLSHTEKGGEREEVHINSLRQRLAFSIDHEGEA